MPELESLYKKIEILEGEVYDLKVLINKLIKTCERMDNHISFVENTYDTLRKPLDFVKEKVNYLSS